MKTALVTGITGQDGSLLADHLLKSGYRVMGLSVHPILKDEPKARNYRHLLDHVEIILADPLSPRGLESIFSAHAISEIYHLGAASFPSKGFSGNYDSFDSNVRGTYQLIDAAYRSNPECRFFFAGSSEMFGSNPKGHLAEGDAFLPRTMYGISKLAGHHIIRNYREQQNKFALTGLLFNHESARRGEEFVTRKITLAAARIKCGLQKKLVLGSLATKRDWSAAEDFVQGFHAALTHSVAQDYVFASGELHSIEEFVDHAFSALGLRYRDFVEVDESFNRPSPVDLTGDSSRARAVLNWTPRISFSELVERMVKSDYDLVKNA